MNELPPTDELPTTDQSSAASGAGMAPHSTTAAGPERSPAPARRRLASIVLALTTVLLAACATGGGPAPERPGAAPGDGASTATAPALGSAAEASAASAEAEVKAETPADAASAALEPEAASSPVAAYLADPAAVTAGRRMFRAVCTGYCHSTTPGVTKDAPNLFDCDSDHGDTDADLFRVITQGVPDTEMLPFEGKIPDDTIWKVIAYVRSNSLECS